jgi:hypothetical protein
MFIIIKKYYTMESIKLKDVHPFLQNSTLYNTFKENTASENDIYLPKEFHKNDFILESFDDLLQIIKTFHFWGVTKIPDMLLKWCIINRHLIVLELLEECYADYLLKQQIAFIKDKPNDSICHEACKLGYYDILKISYELGCVIPDRACLDAAENGHLECLIFVHKKRDWLNNYACFCAKQAGHKECEEYVHKNACVNFNMSFKDYFS